MCFSQFSWTLTSEAMNSRLKSNAPVEVKSLLLARILVRAPATPPLHPVPLGDAQDVAQPVGHSPEEAQKALSPGCAVLCCALLCCAVHVAMSISMAMPMSMPMSMCL